MNKMRTKEEIIEDIRNLVKTKGYIYALCMILIEDFSFNAEEIHKANVDARLSLNEAAYLVRLLIQDEVNFSAPDKLQDLMRLKQETYEFLKELEGSFVDFEKLFKSVANNPSEEGMPQFFSEPEVIAKAIFYSGTGAYDIQHLGLLEEKYKYDKKWLLEERNFDAAASKNTALIIKQILESKMTQNVIPLGLKEKIPEMIEKIKKKHPDDWEEHVEKLSKTIPAMEWYQYRILLGKAKGNKKEFGREETELFCNALLDLFVIRKSDFDGDPNIEPFLKNFSIDLEECRKKGLEKIGGFNCLIAQPIVPLGEAKYFIPLPFLIFEAVHKSPFHWMLDTPYEGRAGDNRGKAGEDIVYKILLEVFGESRTFKSVKIKEGKTVKTDIDVLCVLGNKALCVEVKSKALTALSRAGDVISLAKDFEGAVQKAYRQACKSRREILGETAKFYDENGREITLPEGIEEVYIMGITMEDYPTLAHQAKVLLKKEEVAPSPVFLTVFDLELVSHYLNDPYDFLYYVRQRISLTDFFDADEEIIYLSYHLTHNFSKPPDSVRIVLTKDFGQLVDRNYYPLKIGLQDSGQGDSIRNRKKNDKFDALCNQLKTCTRPEIVDIIFHLLDLSSEVRQQIVDQINLVKQKTLQDGKGHRISMFYLDKVDGVRFGITCISIDSEDPEELKKVLCELSKVGKHKHKGDVWVGFGSLKNSDAIIDGVVFSDQKWEFDQELENLSKEILPY